MMRRTIVALGLLAIAGAAAAQPPHSVPQPVPGGTAPEPLLTREVMTRGQERYDIFCSPCHGYAGGGDGIVVARGFPAPPSFHDESRPELTPERIPPVDRWAIAAYVKALQFARQAPEGEP